MLDTSPSSDPWFATTFSHSMHYLFTISMVSFSTQYLVLIVMMSCLSFVLAYTFGTVLGHYGLRQRHNDLHLFFFSFIPAFRSLIHFELIFICGVK